jgi:uncharacterized OB-fold protein
VAQKPVPVPSPESAPFWKAAREHRLLVPRCRACGKFWLPPSRLCPHCLSNDTDWEEASGRGKIYSFVVFHRVYHPAFAGEVPYVVAIVELEEGPRMLTNVVGIAVDQVRCNMPVTVTFEDMSNEVAIPKFTVSRG